MGAAPESPVEVFIGVGSNIEPERNIVEALSVLSSKAKIMGLSSFYITEALGRPEQSDYYNGVIMVGCDCPPEALKFDILRLIEAGQGRVRTADKYVARCIDLDILAYGDLVKTGAMEIPDPDLRERIFLQAGVLELSPSFVFPDTGELLADSADKEAIAALRVATAFSQMLRERYCHE
jgi:2-amino-4-hydroxy-6-hydroxymethyldihydropteridine diphosphokinase